MLSVEHLEVWMRFVDKTGLLPPFSYLTLLRGSLEGAVLARWLLDPTLSAGERRSRGVGAQWVDYDERRKLEADAGLIVTRPGRTAAERMRGLESIARRYGIAISKPPSRTDLCRTYVEPRGTPSAKRPIGQIMYRLLSGPAHGLQWGLLFLADLQIEGHSQLGQAKHAKLTANIDAVEFATVIALATVRAAVHDLEVYTGV